VGADGETGKLYIVQARPETVQSRADAGHAEELHLKTTRAPETLLTGLSGRRRRRDRAVSA
jgi:pyruvate,water dikinase